jgi:hypothetical protein
VVTSILGCLLKGKRSCVMDECQEVADTQRFGLEFVCRDQPITEYRAVDYQSLSISSQSQALGVGLMRTDAWPTLSVGNCGVIFSMDYRSQGISDLTNINQPADNTLEESMGLEELAPDNTKRAQATAVNIFKKFLASENTTMKFVQAGVTAASTGSAFLALMDRFGMYLAFSDGKGGGTAQAQHSHELLPQCQKLVAR